MFMIIISNEAG